MCCEREICKSKGNDRWHCVRWNIDPALSVDLTAIWLLTRNDRPIDRDLGLRTVARSRPERGLREAIGQENSVTEYTGRPTHT
jgi:hypothetical protein